MSYQVGDKVRLKATFTNIDEDAINPDTVTFRVKKPDGTVTVYSDPVNSSTGVFYKDLTVDAAGIWTYKVIGTGAVAVEEATFLVEATVL